MRVVKSLIGIILVLALIVLAYFNKPWCIKQVNKVRGMYYVYQGDKQYKKHKTAFAIDKYKRALELYPEHYRAWYNLGNIYVVYEDYFSAVDAYENSIKHKPNFILARMNLGIVLSEKLGDFDGAIAQYDFILNSKNSKLFIPFLFNNYRSIRLNKGFAYYNRGLAYKQKSMYLRDNKRHLSPGMLMKAIESYKSAEKILKSNYDNTYNLALAYHLSNDYKGAGTNYCKAIGISPMSYEAHYNLAILLRHLKQYRASIEELEKATLILSEGGSDQNRMTYVFDILNDASKMMLINQAPTNVNKLSDEPLAHLDYTTVNGKIVATEDLDKAILKNFKTCSSLTYFKELKE